MAAEFATILEALERLAPARDAKPVTPANADLPDGVADALYVIAAGNLTFVTKAGTTVPPFAVVAGQIVPFQIARVLPTSGAAGVLALY